MANISLKWPITHIRQLEYTYTVFGTSLSLFHSTQYTHSQNTNTQSNYEAGCVLCAGCHVFHNINTQNYIYIHQKMYSENLLRALKIFHKKIVHGTYTFLNKQYRECETEGTIEKYKEIEREKERECCVYID